MNESFDFVGLFATVRGDLPHIQLSEAVEDLISLAELQPWQRIDCELWSGARTRGVFSEKKLQSALALISQAKLIHLSLLGSRDPNTWWRNYTDYSSFAGLFSYKPQPLPGGRTSPIPPGCTFVISFPLRLFSPTDETSEQSAILAKMRQLFYERHLSYAFINRGRRFYHPVMVGVDATFGASKSTVPVTAFDYDLTVLPENVYERHIWSASWASFLNPTHVEALGGFQSLERLPHHLLERLPNGGAVLALTISPLDETPAAQRAYQQFRRLARPTAIETHSDLLEALRRWRGFDLPTGR